MKKSAILLVLLALPAGYFVYQHERSATDLPAVCDGLLSVVQERFESAVQPILDGQRTLYRLPADASAELLYLENLLALIQMDNESCQFLDEQVQVRFDEFSALGKPSLFADALSGRMEQLTESEDDGAVKVGLFQAAEALQHKRDRAELNDDNRKNHGPQGAETAHKALVLLQQLGPATEALCARCPEQHAALELALGYFR